MEYCYILLMNNSQMKNGKEQKSRTGRGQEDEKKNNGSDHKKG